MVESALRGFITETKRDDRYYGTWKLIDFWPKCFDTNFFMLKKSCIMPLTPLSTNVLEQKPRTAYKLIEKNKYRSETRQYKSVLIAGWFFNYIDNYKFLIHVIDLFIHIYRHLARSKYILCLSKFSSSFAGLLF